jgi:membrane fusion protein
MGWLGRHPLALGLPATLSSLVSVLMAVATAALVTFGSYARRVEVHGVVLPVTGLIQVSSSAAGRVESISVKDGDEVSRDTPLYVVNTDTTVSNGATQEQVLQALAAQRAVLVDQIARKTTIRDRQDVELQRKIENLQAQIQQMTVQVATKEEFTRTLTKDFADYNRFVATGIGNLNARQNYQSNWMRARDELEELRSGTLRLQAALMEAQSQQATSNLETDNEIDVLRGKIADLDQQVANTESRRSIEIRAPGAGRVTAIAAHPGQMVASGARMLTIVPAQQKMRAELLAPSSSIGFIRSGQRVKLRYSAFPYQKFGQYEGKVVEVSHAALQQEELKSLVPTLPASDQSKTFYRVIVEPERQDVTAYGRLEPLQASMQVDAHVLLDRRPIYQWILEPLYGLHGL